MLPFSFLNVDILRQERTADVPLYKTKRGFTSTPRALVDHEFEGEVWPARVSALEPLRQSLYSRKASKAKSNNTVSLLDKLCAKSAPEKWKLYKISSPGKSTMKFGFLVCCSSLFSILIKKNIWPFKKHTRFENIFKT
jgi:hypothetical protein